MRLLYFDAFAGASGDMILGALVAAGVDPQTLTDELKLLGVGNYDIEFRSVMRAGIAATQAVVRTAPEQHHRNLNDILSIIDASPLRDGVKRRAASIFTRLAEAEARVHNESIDQVHFHEVGGTDAIVDIVGACIGFELLDIERFRASALHTGSGTVEMAHGRFPVPPPAVVELTADVPVYQTDVRGELLTPTGAAIITTVCTDGYGALQPVRIKSTGYGAGGREYPRFPNALRIIVGETIDADADAAGQSDGRDVERERLTMLETNIDDLSGQITGHIMDEAFRLGALDCFFTPAQMKKNRPGVLVSILCRRNDAEALRALLFRETTTLGIRCYEVERHALRREFVKIETEFGAIDVKVAYLNGEVRGGEPEFEQCRRAAESAGVSVRAVEAAARRAFENVRQGSNGMKNSGNVEAVER